MIRDPYESIMNPKKNALKNLPLQVKFMSMQVLAWMWCIIFSLYFGSFLVFGITAAAHFLLIFGTFMTAATFAVAPKVVKSKFKSLD